MSNRAAILALCLLLVVSCRRPAVETTVAAPEQQVDGSVAFDAPTRLILFIGDGMGVGQLTAASYAKGAPLNLLEMPHLGFMTTHEAEFLTTDSAASATAISTGRKTSYEAVAVTPGTTEAAEQDPDRHMQTLLELASSHGLRTGMVSTSRISHATPAAFAAHRHHRNQYEQIAADIAAGDLDVLIGPGSENFLSRKDGRDLFAEMKSAGWATATTVAELDAIDPAADRVAALLHPGDYPFLTDDEPREMGLPEMVSRAIALLDRGQPAGWVLMVEGSFIDWCGHALDGACAAVETLELDDAVARARTYGAARSDTLVVVTADHETGGMSVIDPYYTERFAKILGGEEGAAKMAAHPEVDGKPVAAAPPFQHLEIGASSPAFAAEPLAGPGSWGMDELVDRRATVVVGHFSMASRPFWNQKGRFYGAHTPVMVTIHAEGPGAQLVAQARDNADLGKALRDLVAAGAAGEARTFDAPKTSKPRNVILMIGDGMGIPSVTGALYWHGQLAMLGQRYAGLASTHAIDYLVNDSAATATAIATGHRTRKKSVGQSIENGERVAAETVLERAERRGLATGIVTTTPVSHATPAAFFAHQDDRYQLAGIVADLATFGERVGDLPEIVIGSGGDEFDEAARERLTAAGFAIDRSWPLTAEGPHVLALLGGDGDLPSAAIRLNDGEPATPTLADMTRTALEKVGQDEDGFLLVVEGGQIDWRLHEGARDASTFAEVVDFDQAVAVAQEYAAKHPETLVIVTADHDHTMTLLDNHYAFESGRCGISTLCGGPLEMLPIPIDPVGVPHTAGFADAALQGDYRPPRMFVQYAWPVQEAMQRVDIRATHSANFVPILASGPWAHRLEGFVDQPEIGRLLFEWLEP